MEAPTFEEFKPRLWSMFPDAHSIRLIEDAELDEEHEGWCKRIQIETGADTNPKTRHFFLGMATEELFEYDEEGNDLGTMSIPMVKA